MLIGIEKSNISIVKNRIMSGALFKSKFAYHLPSLKSNQFPSYKFILLLLQPRFDTHPNRLIQQLTHINLCKIFSPISNTSISISVIGA